MTKIQALIAISALAFIFAMAGCKSQEAPKAEDATQEQSVDVKAGDAKPADAAKDGDKKDGAKEEAKPADDKKAPATADKPADPAVAAK